MRSLGQMCLGVMLSLLGLMASAAHAGAITAASGNAADVQTALDAAENGDVVQIPAGSFTWTTPVRLSAPKAITIQGAGIDRTVIVDNVNKAGGNNTEPLVINLALGKRFRLTGMTFRGMAQDKEVYNKGTVALSGDADDFRVDHIKFDKPGTSALRYYGCLYGVVDHCVFDLSNGGKQGNVIWHDRWGGKSYGDGSFADDLCLGTEKAIYIEDSTFIGSGVAEAGVVDCFAGGRFVFRCNTVTNDNLCTHGTESSGRFRGVRSYEIYNNTFTTSSFMFCGIYLRGGTGVIFGNTFGGTGGQTGYVTAVLTADYRCNRAYNPWGQVTGSNPWDGNQDASGYPCLDQVGRGKCDLLSGDSPTPVGWPHQASEPLCLWNNHWTPVPNNTGHLVASQHPVIQANRDWFDGAPKAGYTPYIYPHPLTR